MRQSERVSQVEGLPERPEVPAQRALEEGEGTRRAEAVEVP